MCSIFTFKDTPYHTIIRSVEKLSWITHWQCYNWPMKLCIVYYIDVTLWLSIGVIIRIFVLLVTRRKLGPRLRYVRGIVSYTCQTDEQVVRRGNGFNNYFYNVSEYMRPQPVALRRLAAGFHTTLWPMAQRSSPHANRRNAIALCVCQENL